MTTNEMLDKLHEVMEPRRLRDLSMLASYPGQNAQVYEIRNIVGPVIEELTKLNAKIKQLEEYAKFGINCYQDSCENAYVESSVMNRYKEIANSGCMYSGDPCTCCQEKLDRVEEFEEKMKADWNDRLKEYTK